MSARYHIARYASIRLAATSGAGDFPLTYQQLQDPTLVTQPLALNTQMGTTGPWTAGFSKETALENIALWIQPIGGNVSWKVQINGTDNAVAVATTGAPLAKKVFTEGGPIPAYDLTYNCNITNANAFAVEVYVWWVALTRNPLV
jgi:hypothetical protein